MFAAAGQMLTLSSAYTELQPLVSHLSEQVCQLCVDLGPEGGAGYVDEGLSVHFASHLHLLQSSQGFLFCRLKALCDDSWMKTLQQEIKQSYRREYIVKMWVNNQRGLSLLPPTRRGQPASAARR